MYGPVMRNGVQSTGKSKNKESQWWSGKILRTKHWLKQNDELENLLKSERRKAFNSFQIWTKKKEQLATYGIKPLILHFFYLFSRPMHFMYHPINGTRIFIYLWAMNAKCSIMKSKEKIQEQQHQHQQSYNNRYGDMTIIIK